MTFLSYRFAALLFLTVLCFYVSPHVLRIPILVIASLVFCGLADWRYTALLLVSTAVAYVCGLAMRRNERRKESIAAAGVLAVLAMLVVFKYADFVIGSGVALGRRMGLDRRFDTLGIIFPLGISYYTLQSISYILDVRNGVIPAETRPLRLVLYASFFPKLLAGPIERAGHLIPQFDALRRPAFDDLVYAATRIGWGVLKKLVIADRLAALTRVVLAKPNTFSSTELLIATLFYSLQIYIDFGAYTDMAIGIARLFGVELVENFNLPYFATSVTEFWRQWHMSFSSWLRDYVFLPLSFRLRRRRAAWVKHASIMATFVISGLWHGANWTFVVWGALHGVYQALEQDAADVRRQVDKALGGHWLLEGVRTLWTFGCVTVAWVFFQAADLRKAFATLSGIASMRDWGTLRYAKIGLDKADYRLALVALAFFVAIEVIRARVSRLPAIASTDDGSLCRWLVRRPILVRWGVYTVAILGTLILGYYGESKPEIFIYAGF